MIINFKDAKKQLDDIKKQKKEDKFIDSLTDEQLDMFYEIIQEIMEEYDELEQEYLKKVAELEVTKIKSKMLSNKE